MFKKSRNGNWLSRTAQHLNGRTVRFGVLLLAVAVCGVLVSCVTMQSTQVIPPIIPGAEFVGNDNCAACHEKVAKSFPRSVHAKVHVKDAAMLGATGCESCHGPGSLHADADDADKAATIINPGKSADACYTCHIEKQAEMNLPYAHPVKTGKMTCNDCHDPHGADAQKPSGLAMARVNDGCRQCHKEQVRPHLYEHEALREGCVSCHNPHGSINKKMLVENDFNLCVKCHSQVQSDGGNLEVGTRNHASYYGSRTSCWAAGCHTAIHGSTVDSHFRF